MTDLDWTLITGRKYCDPTRKYLGWSVAVEVAPIMVNAQVDHKF